MLVHLGQILDKRYKKTNKKSPPATFEGQNKSKAKVLGAKARYCTCHLHSTLLEGWENHLSHPYNLTPGHTPPLTLYTEPASPHLGSKLAREPVTSSCSPLL